MGYNVIIGMGEEDVKNGIKCNNWITGRKWRIIGGNGKNGIKCHTLGGW